MELIPFIGASKLKIILLVNARIPCIGIRKLRGRFPSKVQEGQYSQVLTQDKGTYSTILYGWDGSLFKALFTLPSLTTLQKGECEN